MIDDMNFTFDQLHVFVVAARGPSFSAAARHLGKAQSAVSTAINNLEIDLGVVLFDRTGRYPVLTSDGKVLLAEAEAILLHCSSMEERAFALTSSSETHLAIGLEDAFPASALVPVMQELCQRFPNLALEILQPSTNDLLEMVQQERVVLGLGCARAHYPTGVGFCRLGQVTLANVVSSEHPLARIEKVSFAQLGDYYQLLLTAQTQHRMTSEYLKSPRTWLVQSQLTLLELLQGGFGWASLPKRLIAKELQSGELTELLLEAYPFTEWSVGLDLTWNVELKPGVAVWLKSRLQGTSVFV